MLSTEGMVYRSVTISEIKVYPECFCKIFLGFGNSITEGIDSVYVNGVLVYKDKQFTGAAPGKMLRHNA